MAEARVPVEQVAQTVSRALHEGLLEGRRALVFHDLDRLEARLDELREAFARGTLHAIAVKANPLVEVLRVVVEAGMGLEAASWEEVCLARAAGCPPDRLVYDSPAKTLDRLEAALDAGLWINVDSDAELARLADLDAPRAARIGLRVNPMLGSGSIAITSTVRRDSKFGVPLARAPELVEAHPFLTGLHVHTGSQGVGLELIGQAAAQTGEAACALGLEWLDVGGGVPVRYTARDPEPPSLAAWGRAVQAFEGRSRLRLLTEPGRTVQAGVGYAVSRVEAVKDVDGIPHLVVHVGADMFLRAVYRADQWAHDFVLLDGQGRVKSGPTAPCHVAGPLCFSGDILARDVALPAAEPGDLLVVRDCGAYTLAMWSRHCSRGLPPTIGVRASGLRTLHPGETEADVVRFWSGPG